MERLVTSNLKLGIIAGGQLGKMLIQEASKWDIISYVMDKDEHCPAGKIASHFVQGDNLDFESVYQFGKKVDVLTFEIENVNIDALKKLKTEEYTVLPDPEIFQLIQDKGSQKEFYKKNNIPASAFKLYDTKESIVEAIKAGIVRFPFVQKLRRGGYDGRGVAVINNERDSGKLLPGASIVEEKVEIEKEISVITARNRKGQIICYPVVEMIFDDRANLVDKLICPSSITIEQSEKAKE